MDKSISVMSRSIMENQTKSHYESILNDFIQNDIKILIGIFDSITTIKFFCHIYKNGMYGENYQWIILGSYEKKNILASYKNDSECSYEQLIVALNGTLFTKIVEYSYKFDIKNRQENNEPNQSSLNTEYNMIVKSYMSQYIRNMEKDDIDKHKCPNPYFHGYAFDGVLAIFRIFNYLLEANRLDCSKQNFHRSTDWFNYLNQAIEKISFEGVTVRKIHFKRKLIYTCRKGFCII